jgi:outer membrane protein assembly factor BamB
VKIVFKTLAGGALFTGALLAQWMTFGGDPQRSGWARNESILNKENAGTLELKWKLRLDNVPKELTSLTPPVIVDQVKTERGIKEYVVVGGSSDNLYAIDADSGKLAWKKMFTASATRVTNPNTLCPFALNATPVIQAGQSKTIYVLSSDGKLHALNATNSEDRFPPGSICSRIFKELEPQSSRQHSLYRRLAALQQRSLRGLFSGPQHA